jgi:hypothetical protein
LLKRGENAPRAFTGKNARGSPWHFSNASQDKHEFRQASERPSNSLRRIAASVLCRSGKAGEDEEEMTLAQRMADGRIPVFQALSFVLGLAEALRVLHEGGRSAEPLTPAKVDSTDGGLKWFPGGGPVSRSAVHRPEAARGGAGCAGLSASGTVQCERPPGRPAVPRQDCRDQFRREVLLSSGAHGMNSGRAVCRRSFS